MKRHINIVMHVLIAMACSDPGATPWTLDRAVDSESAAHAVDPLEVPVEVLAAHTVEGSEFGRPGLFTRLTLRQLSASDASLLVVEVPGGVLGDRARLRSDYHIHRPGVRVMVTLRREGSHFRLAPRFDSVRPLDVDYRGEAL